MSHPGKFVSVNLNRSYGQPAPSSHHGGGGGGGRPSRPAGAGSSAGGGMVVLSRPRGASSLAKPQAPKLSVPPPLNLPSLRKEHERFDGSAAAAGGGVASAPPRSGGPAAGWTKPAPASEKPPGSAALPGGVARPPSYGFAEKAVVLRGEDFPSLKAAVAPPTPPQPAQRPKDADGARVGTPEGRPGPLGMRPQVTTSRATEPLASGGSLGPGGRTSAERVQKPDLGPLPMVRLRYDSDWADDERDTELSLPERDSRERGFGRTEAMLPGRDLYGAMREPFKKELFGRDVAATNKEGGQDGLWRSPVSNQHDRERTDGRPYSGGRGSSGPAGGSKDVWSNSKEPLMRGYGQNGVEQYGTTRVGEAASERYGDSSNNWPRLNSFQNNVGSKVQPFGGNKGSLINDTVAKFGREKRLTGSPAKPLIEDSGFDSISAVNLTAIKKKKEAAKPADFHDPARESFEAELDRILRVQEQERQRVMEEQERAREVARKQEEERERLIREEEERQRLVEEQAKQAAWQAEQERLEAAKRAEEQRIAREEERKRIAMEEERRREAARQKLLELEAKIARRQAESNIGSARAVNDEFIPGDVKDRDLSHSANFGDKNDIDKMNECINTSAPLESSSLNRFSEIVPRVHTLTDGRSSFIDRENAYYSSRAAFPEQENVHHSPRRDPFAAKRGNFPKKDLNDGFGSVSVRQPSTGRTTDSPWALEDFHHEKVPRWDAPRDIDRFSKQSDFDNGLFNSDRFGDTAWLPSSSHGSLNVQQGDRMFQSPDVNELSSFTRPRYSMRQPRVLPPPMVTSVHRSSMGASARHINSSFVDGGNGEGSGRDDVQIMQGQYGSAYQEASRQHGIRPDHISVNEHQIVDRKSPVLGSQSSLSVSSPPSSPPHVSHDEMDVSGDSPALPTSADGERTVLSDNDHAALTVDADNTSRIAASGVPHLEDDEWSSVNNDDRRKQDEYDEDNDSYQEDEINEADDENIDLDDEFLEGQNTPVELEPVILGFDEGVQVEIPPNSQLELVSVRSTERTVGVHLNSGVAEQANVSGSVVHSDPVTEAEKALHALTFDRVNALTEDSNGEPSNSLGTPASSSQLPQASSAGPIFSSASAVVGQNEVPVSLQFGLFTGPPLIPTPVPAIQIGSIQMPIHLHNQFNPSLSHMHPSTTPLYQFGQLRYVRPIAPSAQSLPSQAIRPAHSSIPAQHTLNQNASSVLPELMDGDTNQNIPAQASSSTFITKSAATKLPLGMDNSNSQYLNSPANNEMAGVEGFHGQVDRESTEGTIPSVRNQDHSLKRNYRPTSNNVESSQYGLEGRAMGEPKAPGVVSDRRGRRYGYAVKDINMRSTGSVVEPSHSHKDSKGGFQRRARRNVRRTEFRVRENVEKNQSETSESFCHGEQDEMTSSNGTRDAPARNTNRRELDMNKASRINEASDQSVSFRSTHNVPHERSHGGNKKSRTGAVPDGDTTSLQAGAVRVVKQQGIEVPVDADGFIEVRSKRQIMSVRREQREKENRSKMRMAKAPRKQHSVSLQSSVGPSVNKRAAPSSGEVKKKVSSGSAITVEGKIVDYAESSVPLMGDTASMDLIGPPSTNAETHTNCFANQPIQIQTSTDLVSSSPANLVSGLSEDNNKGASISTPFNMVSWDNSQINQQVMPLTQTQLEEAMRPAKFEQQAGSGFSLESNNALSPTVTTEKVFPSSASPINSLLAGEKIQFGAVTSPTMLPPVSRTVSSGLGAPGSSRPDMKIDRGLPSDNSGPDKAKSKELCPSTEDAEAEAEAAASAVAVAAISTDEGSPADATTASAPDNKSFTSKDLSGLTSGRARTGQAGQSSTEEPLTVALPADLSVDTPSMSLWPPIASPQASGPMLSQFHGAQPSHFSCFDMNSMLGGHIFAFGPSDESAGSQGQHPQRSNALPSAPLGAWPQCHSGVDSFYRPPTGYAGPFITPGGIPGVQGPPHMVVYNHFAPVGQFGQMGLGFMGATYIPGDKQPDWKQSQGPPIVGVSQSDPNSQNMVSGQVNAPSVPAPVPHLRPTSIMPIPSPLTMFDIAPFQTSTDIQMQTCWPHMPVPPLHSVPLSVALQQHPVEGTATQQFVHNVPVDKSSTNNRFQESSVSAGPSDGNKTFLNAAASQYRDELGLVQQPASTSSSSQTVQPSFGQAGVISNEVSTSAKVTVRATPSKVNPGTAAGVASNTNGPQVTSIPSKTHQSSSSSDQQYQHPVNNQDRRARATQKAGTGNEWQRRSGYQGRNQGSGSDRSSGTGRMKQIYVAKPSSTSGHAPSG
ncbi:hypothetical protein BDA96_01G370800 [Sorghum bicolor]|uniref:Uncharacterized protein n=2 Tax=Sorghum bicolor TaxID=4558 RepID=A0A921UZU2_SORBI|nr:uncharacterized protein LOC8080442 isoform X2 [Sorghum bicolor]KAG0550824.1 hypothetical protein BDA96_01G370800 [Sorghum bicolor]|eukprot:XP_002467746.1 uncharacterized protein LOC8080442 isoform X2 [Sorghum bicolor]